MLRVINGEMQMRLNEFLRKKKISARKMADDLGLHYQSLYNYLRRKTTPRADIAKDIVDYTKGEVTMEDLMHIKRRIVRCEHCKQITHIKKDIVQ